jgi:N-acetylneuraminic acid mutarotase
MLNSLFLLIYGLGKSTFDICLHSNRRSPHDNYFFTVFILFLMKTTQILSLSSIGKLDFTNRYKSYLILLFLTVSLFCFGQDSVWIQRSDIPTARWHLAAEQIDGKIYAIGGVNGYNTNEEYNVTEDTWTEREPMPTQRAFVGSGAVDGKIYIIGGARLNQTAVKTVEMYDPVDDTWTEKNDMPGSRFGIGSCVVDGKIYIFGGNDPVESLVESYDPVTDSWNSDLADMPTARWEPECVEMDGKIYVIGGFLSTSAGNAADAVEMYDPVTDSWTVKESMPRQRGGGTVTAVDGVIYYFGGSPYYGPPQKDVFAYDPISDTWADLEDMPFAWFLMASCSVDGLIYLIAGSQVQWPHNDGYKGVYLYNPEQGYFSVNESPAKYSLFLGDNFPNPFRSYTEINYTLQERTLVRLSIFDLLGKEVAVLVNKAQARGDYQVTFNRNGLENGIYTYRLQTSNFQETKKMLLVDR